MARRRSIDDVDPELARKVAALRPGGQRWLKTVLQTVRTMPLPGEERTPEGGDVRDAERTYRPPLPRKLPPTARPKDLDDVILGRADLDEQLEAYPELAEELEGLGDIIDLLRDLGAARRKRGEEILREEILGRPDEEDEEQEES